MPETIELRNITHSYGVVPVLRNVSLTINRGDVVLINGRSGSGKSTLLEICSGLIQPQAGSVFWNGTRLVEFTWDELLDARQKLGYVFQVPALISNHSIFENIALPLRNCERLTEEEISRRVHEQMEFLGLFNVEKLFPEMLSQGQLKAAAIARALISKPEMLILDEILSGLDQVHEQGFINILSEYQQLTNATLLLVTHNLVCWPHSNTRKFNLESGILTSVD